MVTDASSRVVKLRVAIDSGRVAVLAAHSRLLEAPGRASVPAE